jgi:hypothetical protein
VVSPSASRIASPDVEGYLAGEVVQSLSRDFLLIPTDSNANVIIHILPHGQRAYPASKLQLAADLAERRGPREELRAAELLHEIVEDRPVSQQKDANIDGNGVMHRSMS